MDDLITTRQLQDLLHVDRITIYRMLADGRLAGFKVGGQWRFSRRQIESWLREQRETPPAGPSATVPVAGEPDGPALPITCVQAIQSIVADALDVASVTIDSTGAPLTPISNSCAFCELIRSTEAGRQRCAAAWQAAGRARPGGPELQTCHAGLLVAGAPVWVGGQEVGAAVCCQFTVEPEGEGPAGVARLAAELGLPEDRLATAVGSVRVVTGASLEKIGRLAVEAAAAYSKIGQERLGLVSRLRRIAEITKV